MKHTPTPWRVNGEAIQAKCFTSEWKNICDVVRSGSSSEDNAAFIVRAVNHFNLAMKYLIIEHTKEKAGPHHSIDCDLCDFIAEAAHT